MPIERNPRDSRLRYTKQCLYESFLGFLERKSVSDITVSEVCEEAGISRKTFYKYYADQFDLLMAMQDDLFAEYREKLAQEPANVRQITPMLIAFAEQNRTLVKAVFANRAAGNFIDRITDDMWETYRADWERVNPQLAPADVEALYYFVVSGLVGLVRRWIFEHPDTPASEVARQAEMLLDLADPARGNGIR